MKRKKILMACPNYWHSPFQVGSHHLARGFVKAGWDVAYISDPISPFHFLGGMTGELRERFAVYRRGGEWDLDGRLLTYVPGTLLAPHNRPLLRNEWVHRYWSKCSIPSVTKVIMQKGFHDVDLLYFDSIHQRFWLDTIKYRRSVLRVADDNSGFAKFTPALHMLEREIAQSVDVVAYTAANLRPRIASMGPKRMIHLPNGVNYEHFAKSPAMLPDEYQVLPRPIAVYVGAMDIWFDFDLVNQAADALPDVTFVLIGPDRLARTKLRSLPNIHLLGRRPYTALPAYLRHADAGLIPFDVANHPMLIHSINPLKLYEYFASGLPVVSVEWQELRNMASPAVLCSTTEQFIQGICKAVSRPRDAALYMKYAAGVDWQNRIAELVQQLDV